VKRKNKGNELYRMAGIPEGLGAFDNGDGTITVLMNHELTATAGVSRTHGGTGAFVSRWQISSGIIEVTDLFGPSPEQRLERSGIHSRGARGGSGGRAAAPPCSIGNPLLRISAAMPGSRPRNARYASAGSTVLPAENTSSWSRLAIALS
jgi:hypothetical protein